MAAISQRQGSRRPLRVLIVTQYFWPESFRINDLALALRERGHHVFVLTGLPNYPGGKVMAGYSLRGPWSDSLEGVSVRRVPLIPRGSSKGLRLALNYASFAAAATLLAPLVVGGDFDVVFAYQPSPITVALPGIALRRIRRVPLVLWVQDIWPNVVVSMAATQSKAVLGVLTWLTGWIYRRCDRILAASQSFIPAICAQGAEAAKVSYLPNWAEAFYHPVDLEPGAPERGELPEGFRILFAGNIGVAQAFETILAAADLLRGRQDIHWILLGEGRSRKWVEQEVIRRRLAGTVHLLGPRPVRTMPRYFALADALLVSLANDPLYAWTIPSKLQSYLACGKPVLAALEGEGARIVEECGGGLVVGSENPGRLADGVVALSQSTANERHSMGLRCRHYFEEHFEREQVITRLENTLYQVAGHYR